MDDIPTQRVVADERDVATVCVPVPPGEFNRYELLRELGKGGTGVVWLALDGVLGTQVALKTLRPDITSEPAALRELKAEVLINRTLTHPHIVKTFDFVTNGRASAISMEYVSGTNLHRLKGERPAGFFEVAEIAQWILQLCSALDYAHGRRVVHRDVKPANLMIDEAGELKVGDFGIGRTVAETSALTRNSSGTPPFMSPQQTMGERAVPADDIYSIGATIYDLLTGDPPFFRGAIREQALAKVAPAMVERRRELGRAGQPIPAAWEAAVAACLAKEAAGRPKTAGELRGWLEAALAPATVPPRKRVAVWKWLVPLAAGLVAGAAVIDLGPRALLSAYQSGHLFGKAPPSPVSSPTAPQPLAPSAAKALPVVERVVPNALNAVSRVAPAGPLERMVAAGQVTPDEADLLRRALSGQLAESERVLAARLVHQHSLTPAAWRNYSQLLPADPAVAKLRPLLAAGAIREKEFGWLADALGGAKGEAEQTLAERLVDERDLTPAQWRAQTAFYPPPPVDPIIEKIKPFFASGRIDSAERDWLESAERGKKSAREKALAGELLDLKSATPQQWRALTALPYPAPAELSDDPARWPPAVDLPLPGGLTMRLIRIDPGAFLSGTPAGERGRRTNEPLPTPVRIDRPFYFGVTPVTQAQYTAVVPRNPSFWRGHPDWPVDQVDWRSLTAAGGFLDRLNHSLDRRGSAAVAAGLPTCDEWEYAARAGTQSSFYAGGPIAGLQRDPTLDRLANYNRSDAGSPQTVGSYAPNAWGLYDILGNVSEWCQGRYLRGGSWQSNAAGCRIGWRTQSDPDSDTDPSATRGFRLLLSARTPGL